MKLPIQAATIPLKDNQLEDLIVRPPGNAKNYIKPCATRLRQMLRIQMMKLEEERAKDTNEAAIKKWVDYSSKYGLGYLLTNDQVGVHFNDNTKIVLDKDGFLINYFAPDPEDKTKLAAYQLNRVEYPEDMRKKVQILQHFWIKLLGEDYVKVKVKNT